MKLKDYAKSIAKLAKQYPNVEVVYSSDDEGNIYQKVNYDGTMGYFIGGMNIL
jgi:UDP-N-acetylglucosamine 2-epimerase